MTATQILTNRLILKCCGVFSAYSEQKQCVNGCVLTPKKQATPSVIAKFASAHFQLKSGTGKLGRISTESQSQTSNCERSCATTLALMCACFAVAIVNINILSHLSDRVCNSCWLRKVRNLFQLFHLVKNSTKEESVQSPDRFVSNGNYRLLFRSLSEALQIAKCFE